jgi:hypothetical protein
MSMAKVALTRSSPEEKSARNTCSQVSRSMPATLSQWLAITYAVLASGAGTMVRRPVPASGTVQAFSTLGAAGSTRISWSGLAPVSR